MSSLIDVFIIDRRSTSYVFSFDFDLQMELVVFLPFITNVYSIILLFFLIIYNYPYIIFNKFYEYDKAKLPPHFSLQYPLYISSGKEYL